MKNILFLVYRRESDASSGGGEIFLSKLAQELERDDYRTRVLSVKSTGGIVRQGVLSALLSPFIMFYQYWKLGRHRYDLVVEDVVGGFRVPFFTALYSREPVIGVWHQKNRDIAKYQVSRSVQLVVSATERLLELVYRKKAKGIIAPSTDTAAYLANAGFPRDSIFVVPPGGSISPLGQICDVESKWERRLLLCLGKLRRYKCFHHALNAMPSLLLVHPESKLVIAGKIDDFDRGYVADLANGAEDLRLNGSSEIRTNLTEDEKKELLMKATLLIVPSPIEGFSIASVEANAAGTPVIATEGVSQNTVLDGVNGLRVPFGDTPALVEAISKLFDNSNLYASLSRQSTQYATRFTWQNSINHFNQMIKILELRSEKN